tara:strand:+ start:256 stop:1197 length:942 start_codon:yes stop_codon:yes gene_type:complete
MILLTGGAGFIGSNTLLALNKCSRKDIIVVDNINSKEKSNNIKGLDYLFNINKNDLWSWLNSNKPKLSLIIHLGACTDTTENDKKYLKKNNLEYSINLFKIAQKEDIPFIYASSAATYGNGQNGFSDDHNWLDELEPLNEYGRSKHFFDKWLINQKQKPENWAGLKFFNVYGPNETHKGNMASAVYKFVNQSKENKIIKLFKGSHGYEDGEQERDFIYVKDVVDIILWFSFSNPKNGIYNVGSGKTTTFNAIANHLSKIVKGAKKVYIDFPTGLLDIYQAYTKAEINKLRQSGFKKDFISIENGLSKMIKAYK